MRVLVCELLANAIVKVSLVARRTLWTIGQIEMIPRIKLDWGWWGGFFCKWS